MYILKISMVFFKIEIDFLMSLKVDNFLIINFFLISIDFIL